MAAFVLICSERAPGASPMFALPKGAVDAGHVVLQPGVGEQDYFWFNEKYPSVSMGDFRVTANQSLNDSIGARPTVLVGRYTT